MSARIGFTVSLMLTVFLVSVSLFGQASGSSTINAASSAQNAATRSPDGDNEIAAMKADIQKMRDLLVQMKTNAGFAASVTTPLYHQFELESEMWQLQLDQLQHHLDAMERGKTAK